MHLSLKTRLQQAQAHAQCARFPEMLAVCQGIVEAYSDDVDALLDIGALLLSFGYLTRARECFERVRMLAPNDLRPVVNLANIAHDTGDHAKSLRLYTALHVAQPVLIRLIPKTTPTVGRMSAALSAE